MVYKRKDEVAEGGADEKAGEEESPVVEEEKKERRREKGKGDKKQEKRGKSRYRDDEIPKFNSAYEEFKAGYWRYPNREKVVITAETVIPEIPKKLLEQPDESTYHKAQAEIDEKIDAVNTKIKELGERFTERL